MKLSKTAENEKTSFGNLLRLWRKRRRLSQLDLALDAGISTRHLSFVETGRARPSREMVLNLAENLTIPPREQNKLLLTAGFAPVFPENDFEQAEFRAAKKMIETILRGHLPHPAVALDRFWNIVAANDSVKFLLQGVSAEKIKPPVNVLRLSLDPEGLAAKIINFHEWRTHLLEKLQRQIELTADENLIKLEAEIMKFPEPQNAADESEFSLSNIAVPLKLATEFGELDFISATTVFGTAYDVTLSEIVIETFFPASDDTAKIVRREFV